jgi:hypothetical protein
MIVTHFGINNQTSPMEEPQDLLELVGMEPEKTRYFSTMPGTNTP